MFDESLNSGIAWVQAGHRVRLSHCAAHGELCASPQHLKAQLILFHTFNWLGSCCTLCLSCFNLPALLAFTPAPPVHTVPDLINVIDDCSVVRRRVFSCCSAANWKKKHWITMYRSPLHLLLSPMRFIIRLVFSCHSVVANHPKAAAINTFFLNKEVQTEAVCFSKHLTLTFTCLLITSMSNNRKKMDF